MVGVDKKSEPIIEPAPEQDDRLSYWDSAAGKAVRKGAKWGMIVGFVIAQIFISFGSINTPFGSIYTGNMLLVFAFWIGLGSALGAGIGWLSTQKIGEDDDVPPPSNFPGEPYG
jgi:hypothetical protein